MSTQIVWSKYDENNIAKYTDNVTFKEQTVEELLYFLNNFFYNDCILIQEVPYNNIPKYVKAIRLMEVNGIPVENVMIHWGRYIRDLDGWERYDDLLYSLLTRLLSVLKNTLGILLLDCPEEEEGEPIPYEELISLFV